MTDYCMTAQGALMMGYGHWLFAFFVVFVAGGIIGALMRARNMDRLTADPHEGELAQAVARVGELAAYKPATQRQRIQALEAALRGLVAYCEECDDDSVALANARAALEPK